MTWARLVVFTAWVGSALLGCAGATPAPSTPRYQRSPSLDYADVPRGAGESEVLGALGRAPDEWLLAGITSAHPAPGWSWDGRRLRFDRERTRVGHGSWSGERECLPGGGPPPAGALEASTGPLEPEPWVGAPDHRTAWVAALAQLPPPRPQLLSCAGE